LSFTNLSSEEWKETIETLSAPFGVNFREDIRKKVFKTRKEIPGLLRLRSLKIE
jgi:hypothetical protein